MTDELGRWLKYFIKGLKESLKTGLRYHPRNDDVAKLEQIKALIQKPGVTEEWIAKRKLWVEKKATELLDITSDKDFSYSVRLGNAEDFIHSLYEEMPAKKATVSEEFVNKWTSQIVYLPITKTLRGQLKKMLTEAGVEVVKK